MTAHKVHSPPRYIHARTCALPVFVYVINSQLIDLSNYTRRYRFPINRTRKSLSSIFSADLVTEFFHVSSRMQICFLRVFFPAIRKLNSKFRFVESVQRNPCPLFPVPFFSKITSVTWKTLTQWNGSRSRCPSRHFSIASPMELARADVTGSRLLFEHRGKYFICQILDFHSSIPAAFHAPRYQSQEFQFSFSSVYN